MTPHLSAEQQATIRELQAELKELDLKADIEWAKYIHTGDEECFNEVLALDSEREMKGLIAYIPKAGELKVSKVRQLVTKIKNLGGEDCKDCTLDEKNEVRLKSLESVNEWRANYDLPQLTRLPRGRPGDATECTLAQAFKLSLRDLGIDGGEVEVSGPTDIYLSGHKDGEYWTERPKLDVATSMLIENFDDNAYLDLITDEALTYMADTLADNVLGGSESSLEGTERMQEISDELARRGIQYELNCVDCVDFLIGKDTKPVEPSFFGAEEEAPEAD